MENVKLICKTDAEILLDYKPLKDSGFVFVYVKKEDDIFQHYVNCNGKVFGPFDYAFLYGKYDGTAEWSCGKGDIEFTFENNGKDCKTEKRKRKEGNEILSQEEIDQLLTDIAEGESKAPTEEYDEKTHVLRFNKKHQEFFITEKRKYGPYYSISYPIYQNENCFHFIFRKRHKSKNWYYNYNGNEIGPFQGVSSCYYDKQNRAIVDQLGNYNFILIDGKKVKCFSKPYRRCSFIEINKHQIFLGEDSKGHKHFKRDGIMPDFMVNRISVLDNGDVAYSRIQDDTETWFYNDKQISLPVKGYDSDIYDSIITYKKSVFKKISNTPYFMKAGTEYNGMPVNDYDEGFVYLDEGAIQFFSWCVPKTWEFEVPEVSEKYFRYREGMLLRLSYINKLAGRDLFSG